VQISWQNCIDTIRPQFPSLEVKNGKQDGALNDSVILELDRQLHIAICRNTSAYKGCWLKAIEALNECENGVGDAAGIVYFALYEDICRDGGRITVGKRKGERRIYDKQLKCFHEIDFIQLHNESLLTFPSH